VNQITLAEYRQQIEETIEDGRYQEAVAHSKHILEQYPKDVDAYWLLGRAMLEADQAEQATDMFERVLSADPEHLLAWVAMSDIARRQGELEDAVWYLQRAFELETDNEAVAEELRQLYGELEGSEPKRLQLTQSALAKLYLRGDLLTRATTELRKLTEEHPDRLDLKVALIEALWRNGQRLQASEVCQEILEEQPYNLKANLILGEIWSSGERTAEAEPYFDRAEALDPENRMAQELFGSSSPLPPKEPEIAPLSYEPEAGEEPVEWMVEAEEGALAEPEEAVPAEVEDAMETEIEIPTWLEELAGAPGPEAAAEPEEEERPEEIEAEIEAELEPAAPVETFAPEEELAEDVEEELEEAEERVVPEQTAPEEMAEEDALDWLRELEGEEVPPSPGEELEEAEIPAWLAEVGAAAEEEEEAPPEREALEEAEPAPAEIPDWLQDLAPPAAEPEDVAPTEAAADIFEEDVPAERPPEEELEKERPEMWAPETEEPGAEVPGAEEPGAEEPGAAELPAWMESDEMPSGDDALAWLAQLAEGKEEELRAQAQKEGEARLAEIMGRPEAEEVEEVEEPELGVEPEAEAAEEEEPFGWTAFAEEEAVPEEAVPEEAAPPLEEVAGAEAPEAEEMEIPEFEAPPVAEEVTPVTEGAAPVEEEEEPEPTPPEEEEVSAAAKPAAPKVPELIPTMEAMEEELPPTEEPVAAPEEVPPAEEDIAAEPSVVEEEVEEEVPGAPEMPRAVEPAAPQVPELIPVFEAEAPPVEERAPAPEEAVPAEEEAAPAPSVREAEVPEAAEVPAAEVPEAAPTVEEEAPPVAEPEPRIAEAEAVPEEVSPAEAVEQPPTEDLEAFIDAQKTYTAEHPDDHEAQLELGRVLWQADQRQGAVEAYEELIEKGELLDDVIADLEDYDEQWSDAGLMQTLGDAYMKSDRLQDALDTYRKALASL